eukprot:m.220491 g.220491  ORF g.220491 m.220491 type:complete len:1028 (+) comp15116_c1_seq66:491-3574(+)
MPKQCTGLACCFVVVVAFLAHTTIAAAETTVVGVYPRPPSTIDLDFGPFVQIQYYDDALQLYSAIEHGRLSAVVASSEELMCISSKADFLPVAYAADFQLPGVTVAIQYRLDAPLYLYENITIGIASELAPLMAQRAISHLSDQISKDPIAGAKQVILADALLLAELMNNNTVSVGVLTTDVITNITSSVHLQPTGVDFLQMQLVLLDTISSAAATNITNAIGARAQDWEKINRYIGTSQTATPLAHTLNVDACRAVEELVLKCEGETYLGDIATRYCNLIDAPCYGDLCVCSPCQPSGRYEVVLADEGLSARRAFQHGVPELLAYPGRCTRMEMCHSADFQQTVHVTLFALDYRHEQEWSGGHGHTVRVIISPNNKWHGPETLAADRVLDATYNWTRGTNTLQLEYIVTTTETVVVEIMVDGEFIEASPFFMTTHEVDCGDERKVANEHGVCVCKPGYTQSADDCSSGRELWSQTIVPLVALLAVSFVLVYGSMHHHRDRHWKLKMEHIGFPYPPERLGETDNGWVVKGYYKGLTVELWPIFSPDNPSQNLEPKVGSTTSASTNKYEVVEMALLKEIRMLTSLNHTSVASVVGAILDRRVRAAVITEFCENGTLKSLIHSSTLALDTPMLLSLVKDISAGAAYLHKRGIVHGRINPETIRIDPSFNCKITQFHHLIREKARTDSSTVVYSAPEVVLGEMPTQKSDSYSVGMVCFEVLTRQKPFHDRDAEKIAKTAMAPSIQKPNISKLTDVPAALTQLISRSWDARPTRRPVLSKYVQVTHGFTSLGTAFIDKIKIAHKQEKVLQDVYPEHVAMALKNGEQVQPELKSSVVVCFTKIVDFDELLKDLTSYEVSKLLDRLFTSMDQICENYGLFKVETINDTYMCAANLVTPQHHASTLMAKFALEVMDLAETIPIIEEEPEGEHLRLKLGIQQGPIVANVIGKKNPRYCLFGDTVNTSARMTSNSLPGYIQVTTDVATQISEEDEDLSLRLFHRGEISIKGKGTMDTFILLRDNQTSPVSEGESVA